MTRLFRRQKRFRITKRLSPLERLKLLGHHPVMVPIMVIVALGIASLVTYLIFFNHHVQSVKPDSAFIVIISHDKEVQTVPSRQQTVGTLLKKLDITLNDGDVVEPSMDTVVAQDDFRINVYRAVPVQVISGSQRKFTFSAATTPRSIANQVGYKLYPEDNVVDQPVTNFLRQGSIGEQIVVQRSVPVHLNLYGTQLSLRTRAKTVQDLLDQKGLQLASDDQVLPSPDTPISPNLPVFVARKGTTLKSIVEPIAMPVKTINDPNLTYGIRAIRQQGSPGKRVVTYQIDKDTGLRKIVQKVVISPPVQQIVAIGTNLSGSEGDVIRAGIAASDYPYVDYIVSHESRWDPTARNASSGAYGLCQALPGSKMASAGSDWETNPITQLKWCDSYAVGRYGSWYGAYIHWVNNGWW